MSSRTYRYQFEKYAGKKTRHVCPECGKAGEFTRYVDTRIGELLPENFGKCNRSDKCTYHLSPYHKGTAGFSYADEVYRRERGDKTQGFHPKQFVRKAPVAPPVLHTIPRELLTRSCSSTLYPRNVFARLLLERFGVGVGRDLLSRFQIGTSHYWPGSCVFWVIDERDRVRGGQVVLFDVNGHTARRPQPDGTLKRCTSWVHTALATQYDRQKQPRPEWLTAYAEHGEKFPSLFGLPQLRHAAPDQPVALVEAPKTAVLCAGYFRELIWMAVGGLDYLTAERLGSIKGRSIILYPDLSEGGTAFRNWSEKAESLRQLGFTIVVSDYSEQRATAEQRAAKMDLADFLLSQWDGYPPSWD
jgi:hypothetical protein